MKRRKHFEFILPLNETFIDLSRPNGKRIDFVGDLNIIGDAYHKDGEFSVDIDFVEWKGTDIKPVLNALEAMDTIYEAAEKHAEYLFTQQEEIPVEEPAVRIIHESFIDLPYQYFGI
jgi:hypothetical protein